MLKGKKILIGITGSIAAYKIPLLIRLLKKEGAEIRVIATPSAFEFVTPLTLSALSGNPVSIESHDKITGEWHSHIELGLWADLFLIAPVTANTLAKLSAGIADNYLLTVFLSARCKVMLAPAMDLDMYNHPTTIENITALQERGNILISPTRGELASGLCGEGRMEEPEAIFNIIRSFFKQGNQFSGFRVLVTAGPTYEPIDPVRFIGNHSSGLMGFELAKAFAGRGAHVDLVAGPVNLKLNHPLVDIYPVTTAAEMFEKVSLLFTQSNIAVMCAAVADYTPESTSDIKLKKTTNKLTLNLVETQDILLHLGKVKKNDQFLVGFALETNDAQQNAIKKLHNKNLDLIVLNTLEDQGAGFKHNTNKVSLINSDESVVDFGLKSKSAVAEDIVNHIAKSLSI
jgi:phosphopantothenoylcysteine decarboxylase/phosphopantothenate--cysteine ligase